ncbi:unnamed protein product [Prunus brigantina]
MFLAITGMMLLSLQFHLINCMPSGVLTFKTPLQVLVQHGPLPSVLILTPQIFGCVTFIYLHKINIANLILERFVVFLWVMPLIRKATDVLTLLSDLLMSLWM